MSFVKEFKEFISRGNVVDLAVGIVIGAAFGKIVTSLVEDILTPPLGLLIGGVDFKDLKVVIREAECDTAGKVFREAVSINYGNFIQTLVDFLIIAFAIFLVVKASNKFKAQKAAVPAEDSKEVVLLREIRDQLKRRD